MEITLYTCSDDNSKCNKTLTNAKTVDVLLKDDNISLTDVSFIISAFDGYTQYNYCYIPNFNRYYYINSMMINNGQSLTCTCHVDVLKTYYQQIIKLTALIYRQTTNANALIADSMIQEQVNEMIQNVMFTGSELIPQILPNNYSFVLSSYGTFTDSEV